MTDKCKTPECFDGKIPVRKPPDGDVDFEPCPVCAEPSGELVKLLLELVNLPPSQRARTGFSGADERAMRQAAARIEELEKALKKYGLHSEECRDEKYPEAWHCICGFSAALGGQE
jgi:hypothetical protein